MISVKRARKKIGMARARLREAMRAFRSAYGGRFHQAPSVADPVFFEAGPPNTEWHKSHRGRLVTWAPAPLIGPETCVFTIGSCFAVEIRAALRRAGMGVFPDYADIPFDPATQKLANLPERDNINHYDTFNIRQEIERALSGGHLTASEVLRAGPQAKRYFGDAAMYSDPYRPGVHATTIEGVLALSREIDACVRAGLDAADVVVITLGLIECWRGPARFVWGWPVKTWHQGADDIRFHLATFAENYDNVRAVCERLWAIYPKKRIVLTVSPVALGETFTGRDIVTANTESKSVLRAVAGQVCRDLPGVVYWPSYELATRTDVYAADGRHVRDEFVAFIVENFLTAAKA